MGYIETNELKAYIQHLIKKDNYELFDVPELLSFIDSHQQEMWKPNEEQLKALSDAIVEVGSFKMADILESLYDDLQKLL